MNKNKKVYCKNCKWFVIEYYKLNGDEFRYCNVLNQDKHFIEKIALDKFGDDDSWRYWKKEYWKIFNKELKRVKYRFKLDKKMILNEHLEDCPFNNKFDCKFFEER